MRIGVFSWIVLITFLLSVRTGKAQTTAMPYQLEIREGANLQDVIQQLAERYQIDFAYAPDALARKILPAASLSAPDMVSLLQELLSGASVQYHQVAEDRYLLRSLDLEAKQFSDRSMLISGRVVDAATGLPIMNVAIALDTLNLGGLSDEQGAFSFAIPANLQNRSIWIYHIGYEAGHVPLTRFDRGQTIRLQSEPLALDEILIVDRLPGLLLPVSEDKVALRGDALRGLNASTLAGNDVFRRVQMLAGVSADNDLSAEIKIRGSNADETLIILDGMPIYKVDHFYGVFSALNSSYLEEVSLYKNVFPIQYGGRTGGMLLMKSTESVNNFSGEVDINLLSASLTMDIPLGEKLGLSLSGRSSHANLANSKFFDWVDRGVDNYFDNESLENRPDLLVTSPDFGFSDWNGKLLFKPTNDSRLAVNFFHSRDDYLNIYFNRFVNTRFNQERVVFEEDFRDRQNWQNTGTSLQYDHDLGKGWKLNAEGYYSRYQMEEELDVAISRSVLNLGTQTNILQNDQYNLQENAGTRWLFTKQYHPGHQLELGAGWNQYQTDFRIVSEVDTLLSSQGQAFDMQAFTNYKWKLSDDFQLTAGGRLNYYRQTRGFYFAPRLMANYRLGTDFFLKGAYHINYQFMRELTHENRLGQSVDLIVLSDGRRFPVGRADNFMLGAKYQFGHWLVDVEMYHKKLANVLDHSSLIPGFGDNRLRPGTRQSYNVFIGTGTVRGVDVTLAWEYPHYNGHLAYTLSKAVNRFPQIQRGAAIPSRDDRRHQLKWVNSWKWKQFNWSANYVYSSGRPYYDQGIIGSDRRPANVRWIPSYQRLDLGVDYQFSVGSTKAKMGLSVFNVTNHTNVKYLQFIYSTNSEETNRSINRIIGSQTDLLDRTLNVSLGLEF